MGVRLHVSDVAGPGCVSSLDLLSASGLVNYFGKWTDLMQVKISPLLMRKGVTRLALYGLSHLKDERLARLFRDHRVSAIVPRLFSAFTEVQCERWDVYV
jgi:double-strand break repair protein MRE11